MPLPDEEIVDPSEAITEGSPPIPIQQPIVSDASDESLDDDSDDAEEETSYATYIPPQNTKSSTTTSQSIEWTPDDPRFIDSMAYVESGKKYNPRAVSPVGAMGTMQIMPTTWDEESKTGQDPFDDEDSREVGTAYIKKSYDHFKKLYPNAKPVENSKLALASYNYGQRRVKEKLASRNATTFGEISDILPLETRNYVPKILGDYETELKSPGTSFGAGKKRNISSGSSSVFAIPTKKEKTPGIGNIKDFAEDFSVIFNSPDYADLSFQERLQKVAEVTNSREGWDSNTEQFIRKLSNNIWEGASDQELPDMREIAGVPPYLEEGDDKVKKMTEWQSSVIEGLKKDGYNPLLFGNALENYIVSAANEEIKAATIRERSPLESILRDTNEALVDVDKGAIAGITSPIAGALRLATFEKAADYIKNIPDELLGKPPDDYLYETKEDGHLVVNEDGTYQPRYLHGIAQGVGQVGSLLAGGIGLKAAGASAGLIGETVFGANFFSITGDTFEHVKNVTGSSQKAYTAAFFALPSVFVQSIGDLAVISKFINPAAKGLSVYERAKHVAKVFALNGAVEGSSEGAGDVLEQWAARTQTGEKYNPRQTKIAIAAGFVAGGLGGIANISQVEKAEQSRKEAEATVELQNFQQGLVSEGNARSSFKDVPMGFADQLGVAVTENPNGKATFVKQQDIVTPVIGSPEDLQTQIQEIKEQTTPSDVVAYNHERADLLEKARLQAPSASEVEAKAQTEAQTEAQSKSEILEKTDSEADSLYPKYDSVQYLKKRITEGRSLVKDGKARVARFKKKKAKQLKKGEDTSAIDDEINRHEEAITKISNEIKEDLVKVKQAKTPKESSKPTEEVKPTEPTEEVIGRNGLTKTETARLEFLDDKLQVQHDPHNTNNIKAREQAVAAYLHAHPEAMPDITWNKAKNVWYDRNTESEAVFLKDLISPTEDSAESSMLEAKGVSLNRPLKTRFLEYPAQQTLPAEYTPAQVFTETGDIVYMPQLDRLVQGLRSLVDKGMSSVLAYKVGGRMGGRRSLGQFQEGSRTVRIRKTIDIPTVIHELIHAFDFARDIVRSIKDPDVTKWIRFHAHAYYPGALPNVQTEMHEGLTMFIQNYIHGQPVPKPLIAWWDSEIKQKHSDIHKQIEKIKEAAYAFRQQTKKNYVKQFHSAERVSDSDFIDALHKAKNFFDRYKNYESFTKAWVDRGNVLRLMQKATGTNIYDKYNATKNFAQNAVEYFMNTGARFFNGDVILGVVAFKNIVKRAKALGKHDDLNHYLVLKKAAMHYNRNPKMDPITGKVVRDANGDPVLDPKESGISDSDLELLKDYENDFDIKYLANLWWNAGMAAQEAASDLSPDMRSMFKEMRRKNLEKTDAEHGYYTHFERGEYMDIGGMDTEDEPSGSDYLKSIKGGTGRIRTPLEATERVLTQMFTAAQMNYMYDNIVAMNDMGQPVGRFIQEVSKRNIPHYKAKVKTILGELWKKAQAESMHLSLTTTDPPADMIRFLEQQIIIYGPEIEPPASAKGYITIARRMGNRLRFFEITPDILDAFKSEVPPLYKNALGSLFFYGTKRALQTSATTWSLGFQAKNFFWRDPITAMTNLKSKNPFLPLIFGTYMIQATYDGAITGLGISDDTFTNLLHRIGVASSTRYGSERAFRNSFRRNNSFYKYIKPLDVTFDALENILGFGERTTRTAFTMIRARELGVDFRKPLTTEETIELINAFQSSTTDFSRQGVKARKWNFHIPFFTARIADLSNVRDNYANNKYKAIAISTGFLMLGALTMLKYIDNEEFQNIPTSERVNTWATTIEDKDGKERWIGVPLNSQGALFYGIGQSVISLLFEKGQLKPNVIEYLQGLAQNLSPLPGLFDYKAGFGTLDYAGVVAKIAAELVNDWKYFNSRPIIPKSLVGVTPSEQKTEYTPELAIAIADALGALTSQTSRIRSPLNVEHFLRGFLPGHMKAESFMEYYLGIKPLPSTANDNSGVFSLFTPLLINKSTLTTKSHNLFYEKKAEAAANEKNETLKESVLRKKLNKIAEHLSDIRGAMMLTRDADKRQELDDLTKELIKIGNSSTIDNAYDPLMSLYELKRIRFEKKQREKITSLNKK